MARYRDLDDGQWVTPLRRGYRFACCDCGLVHRVNFRVRSRRIEFQMFRDPRATLQARRRWRMGPR